jgi:hypothetical protein
MPLHSGAQHRQNRNIGDRHSPPTPLLGRVC